MSVRVVTDSACSLPASLASEHGITVVPMWLTIGGRQYRDGELALSEVVRRLPEGVTTAGPAPGEIAQAVQDADEGDGVVVLTVSKQMSAVFEAARLGTGLIGGKKVPVVDTRTAAGGQGLVVLAASRAARAGAGIDGVVAAAELAAARTRLVATVASLEHLARGGRVPGAAAWGARWLGVNPLFEFVDGKARPLRPALSRPQALARMMAMLRASASTANSASTAASASTATSLHVAVLHALEPELAEEMLARVRKEVHPASSFAGSFSSVMVAHTGPGLAGLAWWWEETATVG